MRVFLSGPQASWAPELAGQHLLVSFAEPTQLKLLQGAIPAASWVVDSGAFTAWTRGRPVNLDAYIAFLQGLEARAAAGELVLAGYLALDVIPGKPGRLPTKDEASAATLASMENLAKMRAAGLRPWPVFHEGEPMAVLDAYVAEGHEVIALGATLSRGKASLAAWLGPIFERHPQQRFHGLAMTQARLLRSFPFDSVDSTSWINLCRFGTKRNLYLLRGRSAGFWRAMGYDIPPFDAGAAADDLKARGAAALRLAGVLALQDTWTSPPGSPVTAEGQMLITSATSLGAGFRLPRRGEPPRVQVRQAPSVTPAPGQLPLFLLRLTKIKRVS